MMKEKKYYKIGDISKLFNLGVDSIRYYEEVGIITPYRNPENNYRLYCLDDIRKIITIRELLALGFSMEEIKIFESNRSLDHTRHLLKDELNIVNDNLLNLLQQKRNLKSRLATIKSAIRKSSQVGIHLLQLDERPCIMISDSNIPDDYVSYSLLEYTRMSLQHVDTIGSCSCYTLDLPNSNPDSQFYRTLNVFFYSEDSSYDANYILPEGYYISLVFKGPHVQTKQLMPQLFDYAAANGFEASGAPIEFCYIDTNETSIPEEFITELQLPVRPKLT